MVAQSSSRVWPSRLTREQVAERLQTEMDRRGFAVLDLAAHTGIAHGTIRRLLAADEAHSPYPVTLARLALARLAAGLTLTELAALAGRERSELYRIEHDKEGGDVRSWRALAAALRVPLAWLLEGGGLPPRRA